MGGGKGGGGSDAANKSNALLQEQISLQQNQYQQKLKALSQQAFNIEKAQGGMNWNSAAPKGVTPTTKAQASASKPSPFSGLFS